MTDATTPEATADGLQAAAPDHDSASHASDVADLDQLLRSLANDSPLMFLAIRNDGTLAFISGAMETILGAPAAQRLNTQVLDWIHPDDHERAILQMAATANSGRAPGITRFRIRHEDGTWRSLELFGSRVSDGVDDYLGVYIRDGQNQIFLEDVLSLLLSGATRSEALLPVLNTVQWHSAGSRVAIAYFDGKRFHAVTRELADPLAGASVRGMVGGGLEGPELDPWTRCRESQSGVEGTADQLDPDRRALAIQAGLGAFWIEPVVWADDQPPAVVTIWTAAGSGLTPQVHSYGMGAARYLTELIMRWTQQGIDLDVATRQLVSQEKLASLGTLTAGVAHEIRNPLSFIKNFAEGSAETAVELTEALSGESPDPAELAELSGELVDSLDGIARHVKRIDGIVSSMLGFSQEQAGPPRLTNVKELLDTYVDLGYKGYRGSGHRDFTAQLHVDVEDDLEAVLRAQEMGRVVVNLVGNACDALHEMVAQGVDRAPQLQVTARGAGKRLRIVVRDNGVGIPLEAREHIFEPFFTTKAPGQGTGLGLWLCNDIVALHGGELLVESSPGQSTAFTIEIPWVNGTKS